MPLPQSSTIVGKRTMAIKEQPKKKKERRKPETLIHAERIQVFAVQKVACVDLQGVSKVRSDCQLYFAQSI